MGALISIGISPAVLAVYPTARVGVALVRGKVIDTKKLKSGPVNKFLSDYKQQVVKGLITSNVTNANYRDLPVCKSWDKVFSTFGAAPDKRSTIVNLLGKASTEADKVRGGAKSADLGRISDIVDLYNAVSIETRTPMGTVRPSAVSGKIQLRYGNPGESFIPLGKSDETIFVNAKDIVYADDKSVLTYLWNCRDAKHSCVPQSTDASIDVLVFADQAEAGAGDVQSAINTLVSKISGIGWQVVQTAFLDATTPDVSLSATPASTPTAVVSSSSTATSAAASSSQPDALAGGIQQLHI